MDKNNGHFSSPEGISLKEFVNDKIAALEKGIDARFESVIQATSNALAAADRAVNKAESASEKRFDAVNEFRETLADQQRNLMPRSEAELLIKALNEKIDALNATTISRQGLLIGQREGMGIIIGVASVISIIIAVLFKFIV